MAYSVDRSVLEAGKQVFPMRIGDRRVYVKKGRPAKNPLGRLAQRALYGLTRNLLTIPTASPVPGSVEHEVATLRRLASLGVRVPMVLYAERDYFVMSHTGETIHKYLKRKPECAGEYLERTARELRRLHDLGVAHGASQIKNLTLLDGEVHFLDFEEIIPEAQLELFKVRDIFLLLHSFERHWHDPDPERFCRSYGGDDWLGTFEKLRQALLKLRAVRLMNNRLFKKRRMRDIRSLYHLVEKAERLATRTSRVLVNPSRTNR